MERGVPTKGVDCRHTTRLVNFIEILLRCEWWPVAANSIKQQSTHPLANPPSSQSERGQGKCTCTQKSAEHIMNTGIANSPCLCP
jgi:hypothetical protein